MSVLMNLNANLRKASLFGTELHRFVSNKGYLISDKQILPPDTFTFYCAAHDTVSWLDLILCSTSMHQSIIDMAMLYGILTSDHFPVATIFKMEGLTETCSADENDSNCELHRVDYSALTSDTILQYNSWSDQLLSNIVVPSCTL